ncbi:hypothetical protein D2V17_16515 [Aurantiacibacter xanthus]|uniref:Uncharacterized protein n=1 Tax=Aurantiacibacter xanthus TaxID=1784712 RepID=A0A3A1P065_9SPHN|nr:MULTISPECIES: hypothetical protein [Sphingomonadales]RIV81866.1 hypothetical protein D2V17_16515 [Aurantiacibacter xanthus]|tara:strand:- start:1052 stop:1489 length:438 start_codon:yes stop_codon:yes gene_type:complete
MRISHLQALADIVLGDPEALALAYHETITGAEPVFESDAARGRFAVALKAVGIATDAARFQAAYAKLQQSADRKDEPVEPACRDCGSTNLTRDAFVAWDSDTQQWVLSATYKSTTCHACDAESDDLCRWKPIKDRLDELSSPASQ